MEPILSLSSLLFFLGCIGIIGGFLTVWSAVYFNEKLEERVKSILNTVVIDVIFLIVFTMAGMGGAYTLMLIFKYSYLSGVNFEKALRE